MDTHRSVALVVSPFIKRGSVDRTLYTTAAMLRTMELILGLPPMSKLDAGATPMYAAFQATPVLDAVQGCGPARIDLHGEEHRRTPGAPRRPRGCTWPRPTWRPSRN